MYKPVAQKGGNLVDLFLELALRRHSQVLLNDFSQKLSVGGSRVESYGAFGAAIDAYSVDAHLLVLCGLFREDQILSFKFLTPSRKSILECLHLYEF